MAEKVFKMTAEGKAQLEAELDSLKTEAVLILLKN